MVILVSAQSVTITGTVVDSIDGSTLVGVNIVQSGTQNGTTTGANGEFSLLVTQGSTVVLSYVGYVKKEIVVSKNMNTRIQLRSESAQLDELLVIGYSTQKKSDRTGAVANVKAEDLNAGVLTDPIQAMQGKAAGVTVSKGGGDPNAGFSVRIRGASGYESNTQPLFVIDGVPGADPTMISPNDIESYNILKDAASSAIYGSQGSNGVIIITTKKGNAGEGNCNGTFSRIDFNAQMSFDKVAKKYGVMTADEYRSYTHKYIVDSLVTDGGASTDWQDEVFRIGHSYSSDLTLSGGNANTNYTGSINRSTWEGVMKGTSKERTTARLNLSHNAYNNRLRMSGGIYTSFENNDYESYSGFGKEDIIYQAISRNPTDPVYNSSGGYDMTNREFNYENPVMVINSITNLGNQTKYMGNFKADFEVIKGLVLGSNFAYNKNDRKSDYFRPANIFATADPGYGKKEFSTNDQKLMELTATYNTKINKLHNLNALIGYSYQENNYNGFYAQGSKAASDYAGPDNLQVLTDVNWGDIGSWRGASTLIGFFGRVQYNYNSKYYLSGSLRRDGSSKFGENNKWGWFPTVAAGWNMEKEGFMSGIGFLDQLKLRASYGISGNQAIGEYRSLIVWQPSGTAINPETGLEVVTFKPAHNANPDLKWEETSEINIGIDFAILKNKVSGSLEVYKKRTDDLLGSYRVPVPPNLAATTWANSGSIGNQGIELFVQIFVMDKKNFDWKTSLNVARNITKIIDLGEYSDEIRRAGYITGRGLIGDQNYVVGLMEGEEAGTFYLPEYITVQDGKFVFNSLSGGYTTNISEAKRIIVASAAPKVEIGWSNSISFYKNWNLDFALRSMIGNHVYNATKMFFDNPGNIPSLNGLPETSEWADLNRTSSATIMDQYVENASFVKLDFLALSYTFDPKKIKWASNITLFASANNVLTITGYSGVDPETTINGLAYGIDQYNVYPKTRSYTFGLKASF